MKREIDELLRSAVGRGDVPGVVALAADDQGVIYQGAAGRRAADAEDPITPDTMLRIASMTKMITTTAALQLWERGRLDLEAPVEIYRPEFARLQVLEGFDGDTPRLRPPATRATVRQLITHTAGFAYWFWNRDIDRYEQVTGTPNILSGKEAALTAPMVFDPGTGFEYGIGVDWLGRVIEAVSGLSLDRYLAENVTGPLGMTSTTARMSPAQRAVSAPVHVRGDDGAWVVSDIDWPQQPDFWAGGHFLYSTPSDYLRFQRMLLGGGSLDGVRILDQATVEAAFQNQIGDLSFPPSISTVHPKLSADLVLGPGFKWGLGLLLNQEQRPGLRAPWSGAWAGIYNTHFWVDPTSRLTASIFSQCLPFADPAAFQLYLDFERALYASR
ncbi:MAG TPA: serine hydrolase domain-containing protein [Candidatus Dormibacteraeota bacterium]|jgi:methyl acetate hydrolase|nr:serine hydrolase domain-containing protein [Candidatus Dormibacteraeota bacterium]